MKDLRSDYNPNHPLTAGLREIVRKNNLLGGVMLTISSERVGVNSSSPNEEFGAVMEKLGDAILEAFDRGDFDHVLPGKYREH